MKWQLPALLLLLSAIAFAQEQPVVRVEVSPPEVTLGESAEVRITVLVPTWFPKPPVFPSLELANAITRLPPNSSNPTSERVGRETWSGIVRNYRVYPLSAASYRLSDLTMTVTYANPGADPVVAEAAVPEIVVRGIVPPGAEDLDPYVAGISLTMTREVDGDIENLAAGDALVVRNIAELEGLPAIFLPPLGELPESPGISTYADEPIIEDGDVARRSEQFTLVFESGGEFSLPEVTLDWWNLNENSIERASLPAIAFTVAGPSLTPAGEQSQPLRWQAVLGAALVVVVLLAVALRYGRRFRQWQRKRSNLAKESEEYAFKQLRRSEGTGDARAFYVSMSAWAGRLQPGLGARQFAVQSGDSDLLQQTDRLTRSLYTSEQQDVDLTEILKMLVSARHRFFAARQRHNRHSIPWLNPGGIP